MKAVRVRLILVYLAAALLGLSAWGSAQLNEGDVQTIIAQAATRASQVDPNGIIAVVDREGYVLGVWDVAGNANPDVKDISGAIARAGTAAFLSSDQNAFTSRTAGYIIQQHFPPLVRNTANGPLVGVGISSVYLAGDFFSVSSSNKTTVTIKANLEGHSDVNFVKQIPLDMTNTFDPNGPLFSAINPFSPSADYPALPGARSPGTFGTGIYTGTASTFTVPSATAAAVISSGSSSQGYVVSGQLAGAIGTSLNDSPGGVPLYKNGELVGAVGVTGDGIPENVSTGFAIIDGVIGSKDPLLPLEHPKNQRLSTPGFEEGPDTDEDVALAGQTGYEPGSAILATNDYIGGIQLPYVETSTNLGGVSPFGSIGVTVTGFPVQQSPPPFDYPAATFGGVSGEIRFPIRGDPMPGKIGHTARLSAEEVTEIISNAAARSGITRAGIRLPVGVPARVFISVVGNPGRTGQPPPILGVFRTGEATIFSWDVAVQKARTAYFFSNNSFAASARTVGFLAQRYYPPGIDGTPPGPFFGVQEALLIDAFLGELHLYHPNPYLPNEITIFPGGFPLYRKGVLIGAIGVSGDGVDQDDIISASGTVNFEAPVGIRADQFLYRGARLPYAKFPRDPSL